MAARPGAILQRLLLILGGVLAGLALLEGGLQVAALLTRGSRGAEIESLLGVGRRVVCLGDSNTYGLWVKRHEAYPQVLQQVLGAGNGTQAMQVVNLGAPGTNSSRVRGRLGEVLQKLRPDVVLLMVGANDLWTAPAPLDEETPSNWSYLLWRHSRLFRLVYMQRRVFEREQFELLYKPGPAGSAVVRSGDDEIDLTWTGRAQGGVAWQKGLRENLAAIVAQAENAGTELILLTYPSHQAAYGLANTIIREVAEQSGAPLVDLANVFVRVCPEVTACPQFFFRDQHPTAVGYQLAVALLWQHLTGPGAGSR